MFKRICKSMLKEENYIDALSYCAKRLEKCESFDKAETEYYRIDEILWNLATNCEIEDATDNALRIISALRIGLDNM